MRDRIVLHRIAVFARHGVFEEERRLGQKFYISVTCDLDLSTAGTSDDYAHTVGYDRLAELVHTVAVGRRFNLIEALAETVADEILRTFPLVEQVTVRIDKPQAPLPVPVETVAVEICRRRAVTEG